MIGPWVGVVEIMPVDEPVSWLIDSGAMPDRIAQAARRLGMRTLWESGLDRMWQGQTTLEELVRVLGERGPLRSAPGSSRY